MQQPPSVPAKSVASAEPAEAPDAACPAPPAGRHFGDILMERAGVAPAEVRLAVELQKEGDPLLMVLQVAVVPDVRLGRKVNLLRTKGHL